MRLLFVLVLLFLGSDYVSARIGETIPECTARYGKPLNPKRDHAQHPLDFVWGFQDSVCFSKRNIRVLATFSNGTVDHIGFSKEAPFAEDRVLADEEIAALLKANSEGKVWVDSGPPGLKGMSWQTTDNSLSASLHPGMFIITTAAYAERAKAKAEAARAEQKAAAAKRVEGF